jgi:hypothetical protein
MDEKKLMLQANNKKTCIMLTFDGYVKEKITPESGGSVVNYGIEI